MASRRNYGSGSLKQRPDGSYRLSVELPPGPDGKRRRRYVTGKTQREARAAREALLKANQRPAGADELLGDYLGRWLERVQPTLRRSTWTRYSELLDLHAIPTLGAVPIGKLAPDDLRGLYRSLDGTLAPRTVGHLHRVLHRALRDATAEDRLLAANPADAARPPKAPAPEMRALRPEEARRLLDAAVGDPLEALYVLALTTGMRQGELLGLRWADVDTAAGALEVRRSIRLVRGEGWQETEPKTRAGRRRVPLLPVAVAALAEHRRLQLGRRVQAGARWVERDLVFPTRVGTPMQPGDLTLDSFRPLLERAGLPRMRFHELRHTAVSLMLAAGQPVNAVAKLVGHASPAVTVAIYGHAADEGPRRAAEALGKALGNAPSSPFRRHVSGAMGDDGAH